jgi:hypothetical protein
MGCCAGIAVFAGAPRFALVLLWLFTHRLATAFDSFLPALVGFVLLPYTTVFYALAYAPIGGVRGIGWLVVMIGVLLDLGSYSGGAYRGRSYGQPSARR